MYTDKLRIYQQFIFIAYDICISKHAFPIITLQNIMCKCAKSSSFWGIFVPQTPYRLCPWTPLAYFRPRTSLLAIVYSRPMGESPPPKKIDETEEPEARMLCLLGPKSLDFINLAAITSVNLAVSAHTLTSKQPVQY